FIVNNSNDVVIENISGGEALVVSSVSYTLGASVNTLTLTGTGNFVATGNANNDVLSDGSTGIDTLIGNSASGDDTFVVNNSDDGITENVSGGDALVESNVSYTLSASVHNL